MSRDIMLEILNNYHSAFLDDVNVESLPDDFLRKLVDCIVKSSNLK